jgi:hypothetical protein
MRGLAGMVNDEEELTDESCGSSDSDNETSFGKS